MSGRHVKIALVGDKGAGKSSLVSSAVTGHFQENCLDIVPEVRIPPEALEMDCTLVITDTPSGTSAAATEQREKAMQDADVVCLVYAVDNKESFARLKSTWLPRMVEMGLKVPVILVGNKIDTRGDKVASGSLEQDIMPIMDAFKTVETCVECSAKKMVHIREVFVYSIKSVLHPTAPLFDTSSNVLKQPTINALKRIFKLSDKDRDGILSDKELNAFQVACFGEPLAEQEISGIKAVVKEHVPEGVAPSGLTVPGFLFLHTLFIRRGRPETTWTVLRKYGYNDNLELTDEYLGASIKVGEDQSVELTATGYNFLKGVFQAHDLDKDGSLSASELTALFDGTPGQPWGTSFPQFAATNNRGYVTLQGFLSQWSMTTLLDYRLTLRYLSLFGYEGDLTAAIKVTRGRKADRRKQASSRNVLMCYVVGAPTSGKSSLLNSLVGAKFQDKAAPAGEQLRVNAVEMFGGNAEKYLVLKEIPADKASETMTSRKTVSDCDLVCFVYDQHNPESFAFVAERLAELATQNVPCVFVATKNDLDAVSQGYEVSPQDYCARYNLPRPVTVSAKTGDTAEIFGMLVAVALKPHISLPQTSTSSGTSLVTVAGGVTAAVVLGAGLGYLWKWLRSTAEKKD